MIARRFSAGTSFSVSEMKFRIPGTRVVRVVGLALDELLRREAAALERRLVRERALQRCLVVPEVLAGQWLGDRPDAVLPDARDHHLHGALVLGAMLA
eukprot:7313679-Prymnesium_polylepis.1